MTEKQTDWSYTAPAWRPHCTGPSTQAHAYTVQTPYASINRYLHLFIPFTGKLWSSLPLFMYPRCFDLNTFKRRVRRRLEKFLIMVVTPNSNLSSKCHSFREKRFLGCFVSICFCSWAAPWCVEMKMILIMSQTEIIWQRVTRRHKDRQIGR